MYIDIESLIFLFDLQQWIFTFEAVADYTMQRGFKSL